MNIMKPMLLIILIFASILHAADFSVDIAAEPVLATGYGADERSSLDNALANAVEQVVGTYVASEIILANRQLIEESIISKTAGYVQNYNVLSVKKDSGAVRTFIEAEVDVLRVLAGLQSMNIALLELDGDNVYGNIMANAARIENTRQYMKSQWPLLFRPASKFLEFTIDNIYFDEGRIQDNKVPFVVRFYMEPDYAAYDAAVKQLTFDLDHFQIAEEAGQDGTYSPVRESFRVGDISAFESAQSIISQNFPREGDFQVAVKHGQRYVLRNYRTITPFQEDVSGLLNNRGGLSGSLSDALFRIQFKSGAGEVLYEDIFPLFPVKDKISMFLSDKSGKQTAVWVDNKEISLKTIGYVPATGYDKRPEMTPYIYIEADGRVLAMDKLFLGYQDSIDIASVRKITTITIERLK